MSCKIFGTWCLEEEIRMVLNDTTICCECGCEVWFEDTTGHWNMRDPEFQRNFFGWVKVLGELKFKVNSFGQGRYLPSVAERWERAICSFCIAQKEIARRESSLRYRRDQERKKILSWLGIRYIEQKMNKDDVNEMVNFKRVQHITKMKLKEEKI